MFSFFLGLRLLANNLMPYNGLKRTIKYVYVCCFTLSPEIRCLKTICMHVYPSVYVEKEKEKKEEKRKWSYPIL